jgi:hypothetical protein
VVFGGSGLIREVVFGGRGLIRGCSWFNKPSDHNDDYKETVTTIVK